MFEVTFDLSFKTWKEVRNLQYNTFVCSSILCGIKCSSVNTVERYNLNRLSTLHDSKFFTFNYNIKTNPLIFTNISEKYNLSFRRKWVQIVRSDTQASFSTIHIISRKYSQIITQFHGQKNSG